MSDKWLGRLGRWGLTLIALAFVSTALFGGFAAVVLIAWWPIAGNLPFWQPRRRERPSDYGREGF